MFKEIIVSIIIIVCIVVLNFTTQSYAEKSVDQTSSDLNTLKENIKKNENINSELEKVLNNWQNKRKKLAYFIEHDELEKVETNLTNSKSYIEVGDNNEAINSIDEAQYILKHIKQKNAFNLENIF